jgi:hypothetical protein
MRAHLVLLASVALPALALDAPPVDAPAATAQQEAWAVALEPPTQARPGEPARATVRIRGRAGYHVNGEYPTSFVADPAAAATLGQRKVMLTERLAATPCAAEPGQACEVALALPFSVPAAGGAVLSGTLAFSVCTAERCLIEKVRLAAPVPVG